MKHCGKSTIGKQLAERLSAPFADSDELLLSAYNDRHPSPFSSFRDLYREKGRDLFCEYEQRGLKEYLANEESPGILSLGGGIADNSRALDIVHHNTYMVFLMVPFETLFNRVMLHGCPPFLDAHNPEAGFLDMYTRRNAVYNARSSLSVELGTASIEEAVTMVYDALMEEANVWK